MTTFRQQFDYPNYLNLKRVEAKTKRTLNTARRNSFRAFCDNLDRTTPHSRVWRTIKIFKTRFTQPTIASCSADREVIAHLNYLIDEICPPTVFNDQFPTNFRDNPFLQAPFSESEFDIVITSLKIKSSPGLDKIDFNIIHHFPKEALSVLLLIYNQICQSGTFPSSWNNFLILFIPKSTPGKFRPISLASCLFKLMEKLIHNRLN